MNHLHRLEIFCYFCIWTVGVFYSIYKVYIIGNHFIKITQYDDFSLGWPFIKRMKDISDSEWNSMIPFLCSLIPCFFCHILVNEVVRWKNRRYLPLSYFFTGSICVMYCYGPAILLIFITQPVTFHAVLQIKSRIMVWCTSLLFMIILNMNPMSQLKEVLHLPQDSQYLISVTLSWIHLRCISFCLEKLMMAKRESRDENSRKNFLSLLAYIFYLPLLFLGPVMLYREFEVGVSQPFKKWNKQRIISFILNNFRFFGWLIFNEISLHYIYSSALAYQPQVVYGMDSWTLFGLGYCMGQFFMNKYTVLYGIPSTFSRFEQFDAPVHPKCIARIHLYSDMWKNFDVGLYSFLVRYIYIPTCGKNRHLGRKCFASFLCFTFVYIWHGTNGYIFVWAALNFLGITIEGLAKVIYFSPSYQQWEGKCFTARGTQRFHALIASPLLMMSALSNFYFFGGIEIGNIFVQKILEGWKSITIVVIAFLYCCCQVSMEVKEWEKRRKVTSSSKGWM